VPLRVAALVPYLALSAALQPLTPIIATQLDMSLQAMGVAEGMANAGYAIGTVFAVQFALHLPQRRMLYGVLLLIGSVLAASATATCVFVAGHTLQGLSTRLLLIAAVPPLIVGYPAAKTRWTVVIMNICVFGAVALGPVVGGIQASTHAWRPLFWIVAGIAVAALLLSLLTFQDVPPPDRSGPRDPLAVGLAASGCVAAFFGAAELLSHRFLDGLIFGPLIGGLALIVTLLVAEYRGRCALLGVRPLVSTLPLTGILIGICAAAASVSAIALSEAVLAQQYTPLHLGLLYLPEFGLVLSAIVFGAIFRTRALHYFVLAGTAFLSAGIVLIGVVPPTEALTLGGSGLIGEGVGSSVTPALIIGGFSMRSGNLQRVFAIVELLRAMAAFMIAPIMLHLAMTVGRSPSAGTTAALWIWLGLSVGGALVGMPLRARPRAPADTCAGTVARRRGARLVLPTAAGANSQACPAPRARGGACVRQEAAMTAGGSDRWCLRTTAGGRRSDGRAAPPLCSLSGQAPRSSRSGARGRARCVS
jgi:predicted MFS family arabinose efflux permease